MTSIKKDLIFQHFLKELWMNMDVVTSKKFSVEEGPLEIRRMDEIEDKLGRI